MSLYTTSSKLNLCTATLETLSEHGRLFHPPYPTVGRPRCFMRFFTSSDSSCRSERRYRLSRCCEMRSALLDGLALFLLSRRAHCMLFFLSSGCSDWSLVVEFLWDVFSFQDSPRSRCSTPCSTLMDSCDWESAASALVLASTSIPARFLCFFK